MIFDDIKNIKNYAQIDEKIANFITGLNSDVPTGRVYLSEDELTYANIDEYMTKLHDKCKLEAHRKYIDIQIIIDGIEELDFTDIKALRTREEYDSSRDVMFFHKSERVMNKVVLTSGKFVMLYPHEAHQPQMAYKNLPVRVKKAVIKIPV